MTAQQDPADLRSSLVSLSRRGVLVVIGLALALHLLLALNHLSDHRVPALSLLALVVTFVGTGVAVADRPWRGPHSRLLAATVACAVVLVAVLVSPFLRPSTVPGYANWWPGGTAPILAALCIRGHTRCGLAVVAATGVLVTWISLHIGLDTGRGLSVALNTMVSPVIWAGLGLAIRALMDRAQRSIQASTAARLAANRQHTLTVEVEAQRQVDEAVISSLAGPALQQIAAIPPHFVTAEQRLEWDLTGRAIRDELVARALLDDTSRAAARQARERGVLVRIEDGRREDPRIDERSAWVVAASLRASSGPGTLTIRRPSSGATMLTVVFDAHGSQSRALALADHVMAQLPTGDARLRADVDEGVAFVELVADHAHHDAHHDAHHEEAGAAAVGGVG